MTKNHTLYFFMIFAKSLIPSTVLYVMGILLFYLIYNRYPRHDSAFLIGTLLAVMVNAYRMMDITKDIVLVDIIDYNEFVYKVAKKRRFKIVEDINNNQYIIKTPFFERLYANNTTVKVMDKTLYLKGPRRIVNKFSETVNMISE